MIFDENYYKTLNYTDYLSRRNKYLKTAKELSNCLESVSIIHKHSSILDYGCATGFLMEGFKVIGYRNVYGYDISEWASKEARRKGLELLKFEGDTHFSLITALDVFEHMTDEQIHDMSTHFSSSALVVRIPCSIDGKTFHLDVSKRDPTHINCKTKKQWQQLLNYSGGYQRFLDLNLLMIYDSPGVMCTLCLR